VNEESEISIDGWMPGLSPANGRKSGDERMGRQMGQVVAEEGATPADGKAGAWPEPWKIGIACAGIFVRGGLRNA